MKKVSDIDRQLLQFIANHCNEARAKIDTKDDSQLSDIISQCNRLAYAINNYLD